MGNFMENLRSNEIMKNYMLARSTYFVVKL